MDLKEDKKGLRLGIVPKSTGVGGGDMLKSVYDTDGNSIVDKAEKLSDGVNEATAADTKDAVDKKHDHINKAILDLIEEALTSALKTVYDDAVAKVHEHSNKAILDLIEEALTSALKTAYDDAVTKAHTHANKAVLDLTEEAFTTALKSAYDSCVVNEHTHSNKATLDLIEEAFTTALKSAYDDAVTKAHIQNTDQKLDEGGANEVGVADIKDAVDKKHVRKHDIDDIDDHNGVSGAIEDNIIVFDENGLLKDSGFAKSIFPDTKIPTGFPNITDSVVSFSDSTPDRTLTIEPAVTSFYYYINGVKYTKSSSDTVQITDTEGIWYIYYNGSTLTASQNIPDFNNNAFVSTVYWDFTNKAHLYLSEERHGIIMDTKTHHLLHYTVGVRFESGFGLSGYTLNSDADSDVTFGVENGVIHDEDIEIDIQHADVDDEDFEQKLTDPAQIEVWYRDGSSNWRKDTATDYAFKNTASGRVNYNLDTAGNWSQQEVTDNYYVAYWLFATNDKENPIICIQGQRQDSKLNAAKLNNNYESLSFGTVPFQEMKLLFRIIIQTKNTFGGARKAKIQHIEDLRSISNLPAGTYIATAHSSLTGLTNQDHPASSIYVDISNFGVLLSSTDDDVQKALDTLDDHTHASEHDRQHAIDSADDHTSDIPENNLMDADVNGLPDNSGLAVTDVSDAVTKKHEHANKTELDKVTDGDHDVRTDNPHSVTKDQVGLGNVTNDAQLKPGDIDDFTIKYSDSKLRLADRIEQNILLNAFRIAINGSLVKYNMVDGIVDEFEDESGVDTGLSLNEDYDADNDLYEPLVSAGIELDYMEYATDGAAQAAYVSSNLGILSNADIDDEDMANISDWADGDVGDGASTQVTFDSRSCMKMDGGTSDGYNNYAVRSQDIGSFGARTIFSLNLYCDLIGTNASDSVFYFRVSDGSTQFYVRFCSDGLFVYDGSTSVEVGTDLVVQDAWQEWTFDVDWTAKTVDVYLDGILKASDVDCSYASVEADGLCIFAILSPTIANTISYIDWFKAGSDTTSNPNFPLLQCYSESTIKQQGSYSLKVIATQTDSLNDTLTKSGLSIDLTGINELKYDIYALRTGSNIKIGIHDSGGTTTEHTANVSQSNVNQQETIDLSGVADANKDDIDSIIITIINADAANTFYIDNFYAPGVTNDMTLISQSFTAEAQPGNSRLILFEEDTDAITENTDLKAYISRDGGTTYTQITLVDEGDYGSSKRILSGIIDISGQPAGTTMKWKLTTHNAKKLKVHGIGVVWD